MIQIIVNAIINGLLVTLVAVGFNVIFSTTRIFHLAHAALYVLTVYLFLALQNTIGVFGAIIGSLVGTALVAWLIEKLVYRPLISQTSNSVVSLISSMGVYLFIINAIALFFGNEVKVINSNISASYNIMGITFTFVQLMQLVISTTILAVVFFVLYNSRIGLTMRAVAEDATIAAVMGIPVKTVRISSLVLGSVLAGIAALLKAWDIGIDPYSGMSITFAAAVAVILGGTKSFYGTLIAAVTIAIIQNLIEFWLSAQWKDGITFGLLLVALLFRTEGIVSNLLRIEER